MQNDAGSTVNLVVATQPEEHSFLTKTVDLKRVAKELTKASSTAVEVLLKLLESKDERVRMQAATKLLEFQITVAKEISHDQMQRLIAEIKLNGGSTKKLIAAQEGGKKRPVVDFQTIRQF